MPWLAMRCSIHTICDVMDSNEVFNTHNVMPWIAMSAMDSNEVFNTHYVMPWIA